jgi:hypothetical protein
MEPTWKHQEVFPIIAHVATGDCFKESTAAARRNELAGGTDAVNHYTIADCVLRRFDHFTAQGASDHASAFLSRQLFLSFLPPSFYAPCHKRESGPEGVMDSIILRRDLEAAANLFRVKKRCILSYSKRPITCCCK